MKNNHQPTKVQRESEMKKIILAAILLPALFICGCCQTESSIPADSILLDVRSEAEFAAGHLPGAINISHEQIKEKISSAVPNKNTTLLLYCRSGRRVKAAIQMLSELGYTKTVDLGGIDEAAKSAPFIEFSAKNKR